MKRCLSFFLLGALLAGCGDANLPAQRASLTKSQAEAIAVREVGGQVVRDKTLYTTFSSSGLPSVYRFYPNGERVPLSDPREPVYLVYLEKAPDVPFIRTENGPEPNHAKVVVLASEGHVIGSEFSQ